MDLRGNGLKLNLHQYRRKFVALFGKMQMLDEKPVTARERACAVAWVEGGAAAEEQVRRDFVDGPVLGGAPLPVGWSRPGERCGYCGCTHPPIVRPSRAPLAAEAGGSSSSLPPERMGRLGMAERMKKQDLRAGGYRRAEDDLTVSWRKMPEFITEMQFKDPVFRSSGRRPNSGAEGTNNQKPLPRAGKGGISSDEEDAEAARVFSSSNVNDPVDEKQAAAEAATQERENFDRRWEVFEKSRMLMKKKKQLHAVEERLARCEREAACLIEEPPTSVSEPVSAFEDSSMDGGFSCRMTPEHVARAEQQVLEKYCKLSVVAEFSASRTQIAKALDGGRNTKVVNNKARPPSSRSVLEVLRNVIDRCSDARERKDPKLVANPSTEALRRLLQDDALLRTMLSLLQDDAAGAAPAKRSSSSSAAGGRAGARKSVVVPSAAPVAGDEPLSPTTIFLISGVLGELVGCCRNMEALGRDIGRLEEEYSGAMEEKRALDAACHALKTDLQTLCTVGGGAVGGEQG